MHVPVRLSRWFWTSGAARAYYLVWWTKGSMLFGRWQLLSVRGIVFRHRHGRRDGRMLSFPRLQEWGTGQDWYRGQWLLRMPGSEGDSER